MFIYKGLRRVTEEKLRHDEQSDIFLAVESLLEDVASVTVGGKLHDASATEKDK